MKITDKDLNEVVLWAQFGTRIIQIAIGSYQEFRKIFEAAGVPNADMARADAEYERRIAQARQEQEG